jgi:hypothetical protein
VLPTVILLTVVLVAAGNALGPLNARLDEEVVTTGTVGATAGPTMDTVEPVALALNPVTWQLPLSDVVQALILFAIATAIVAVVSLLLPPAMTDNIS